MLMMEIETDPLSLKDPLDCSEDVQIPGELPNWNIHLEPEIVPESASRDLISEPENQQNSENRLRVRRTRTIDASESRNVLKNNWRPKGRRKNKNKSSPTTRSNDEKSTSDGENWIPSGKSAKHKAKKDNYLKKYKKKDKEKGFVCSLCKKAYATSPLLKKHVLRHCQTFYCEYCDKTYNTWKSLQRHVAASHGPNAKDGKNESSEKEKEKVSSYAKKEIQPKRNRCKKYYEHLKSERKYQCEICMKSFITNGHLNTHMHCHSEKKWKCQGCGRNFSCERSLTRHKDTFPGKHWFPCKLCDMSFFRVTNIVKHMEIKHPEAAIDVNQARELNLPLEIEFSSENENNIEGNAERLFICATCLKVFPTHEALKIHEEAMHFSNTTEKDESYSKESYDLLHSNLDPKYKCSVCSKEFVSLEGFEYHRNNQHVVKEIKRRRRRKDCYDEEYESGIEVQENEPSIASFICKICAASFSAKSALQAHLKFHNIKKNIEVKTGTHLCCICPRSFASSDGLKYHLATHTGERRYSCGQCGKKFIKKTHLTEHIATHSKIKYFRCVRCPRAFSTHSAYKKHLKLYPGPHSFPCTKCGKLFIKESMIEKHICVDLVKITIAPEVKALLSEDMIEEYLCLAEEQAAEELARRCERKDEDFTQSESLQLENQSNSHSCYKCFKVFPNLSSLQSHQLVHIGKQNYQCRFCPESFKRADAFGAHIRNHLGSTPYMCLKCNRKFISPLTLSIHAKNYPGDHSFTCQKCQRWFPSEKRVERHECILQNSDVFKCACGSVFKNWNELLEHAGTKPYKCCSCDLKYPTLIALARHIKKHTGVRPFKCEICGKSFRAKNNYLYHKNIHADAKEIECEHCDFKSKSQKRIDFHLFRKHNIGSNSTGTLCPFCGIIFPFLSHMKRHVEREHGDELNLEDGKEEKKMLPPVLCTFCGKLLNNKYTLANHMKKVHDVDGLNEERMLKCEVCLEKFKSSKSLQRHTEIHEPPGLRICKICHEDFYFAKDLNRHMRKHDTNKPYSCLKCGKSFKVSVSLKYHSSICGDANEEPAGNEDEKEERLSPDMFYGHIEELDINNRSYSFVWKA